MAITLQSSSLSLAANNIVAINSRSQGSTARIINQYKQFSSFLEVKTSEINQIEFPSSDKIKKLSKINIANTFGSAGGLLSGLLGGALDVGGLIRGIFPGKGKRIGQRQAPSSISKPKPILKGNRLRMGGIRAIGITNALFAGLDFASGLAEGESVGKSAAGTAGALAGSLLGGAIGQTLIPIPGVGFMIGSAAGSFLGGWTADRVYDAASGGARSARQKQEEKLKEGKRQEPQSTQSFSTQKRNKVLSSFDSSVVKLEGFVKGILDGKIMFGMAAPMEDASVNMPAPTPTTGQENGAYTAEGGDLPSRYAGRSDFNEPRTGYNHQGEDYDTEQGTPISLIIPGKVVQREDNHPTAGGYVEILHPDGTLTRYLHLSKIFVNKNEDVPPGKVIGQTGGQPRTFGAGRSTGPHLHFEYRPNAGAPVDPKPFADKYFRLGGNVRVTGARPMDSNLAGAAPTTDLIPGSTVSTAFGRQSSMPTANIPAGRTTGIKGYIIVPGHIAGGGAPGERAAVEKVAISLVRQINSMFPGAKVMLWNDRRYGDSDAEFKRQISDLKKLEDQGWEIIELHFDASDGTGRGIILPHNKARINPLESIIAGTQGAYPLGFRNLGGPRRGNYSLLELGNMTPELKAAIERGDQRAADYFTRDTLSAFYRLAASDQLPGYSAGRVRGQAAPMASYAPASTQASNLNINYRPQYNAGTQVIFIDRPTVAMLPMPGASGAPQVIPIQSTGGSNVNIVVSSSGSTLKTLNKIQEYRLV